MELLAWRVVATLRDYDPYGFDDDYDSDEEAFERVMRDLSEGGVATINALLDMCHEMMEG